MVETIKHLRNGEHIIKEKQWNKLRSMVGVRQNETQ